MRHIWVSAILLLILTAGCNHKHVGQGTHEPLAHSDFASAASRPEGPTASSNTPDQSSATIADDLLALEFGGEIEPQRKQLLTEVITGCAGSFGSHTTNEQEQIEADRFFGTVDKYLIEHNFIFPPGGLIDLLRNALTPRFMTQHDYVLASAHPANRRRLERMKANMERGGDFYFADCDLAAILYVAVAQKLRLPVVLVEVPNHNFVRWSSPTLRKNWDCNDGVSYSDDDYARRWGVTEVERRYRGALVDMPGQRVFCYWLDMIGDWDVRQDRYNPALSAFRSALATNYNDLDAANSLAWFLSTCPDPTLRNGHEAAAIAKRVTDVAPRANWLDTLAAAQAEAGDFQKAVETEEQAKNQKGAWGVSGNDVVASFEQCITTYRNGKTYVQGVEGGLINAPKLHRPYD